VHYQELRRKLRRLGFRVIRQGGNHEIWESPDSTRRTAIPLHRGDVPLGTLRAILRELDISFEQLEGRDV
jgi:predicted RNA binding protein YcfA (HicA-like mRNA interferase family)